MGLIYGSVYLKQDGIVVKIRDPSDFLGLNPGSAKYKLCDFGQVEWHLPHRSV